MNDIKIIRDVLKNNITSTPEQAKRFFKTGIGSYGEKDEFIGVRVPTLRKITKTFAAANKDILNDLLHSKINEERLLALFILIKQYERGNDVEKREIYQFYINNLTYINNWNLVDSSAHLILGAHAWDAGHLVIERLAKSNKLWERRIAIIATLYFIRKNELSLTFQISLILLHDSHDLIHKAVGWMLREAGKRDEAALTAFLYKHSASMPKTMLNYASERLDPELKKQIKESK